VASVAQRSSQHRRSGLASLLAFVASDWTLLDNFERAEGFEQLQLIPLLIITPLTFLGGTFYSISVLPPVTGAPGSNPTTVPGE